MSIRFLAVTLVIWMVSACGALPMPSAARANASLKVMAASPSFTGDVRHHARFASRVLGNQRDLWVYVPPDYDQHPDQRYPVLYMHDGNNLFDAHTAFGGVEWGMDETAERLIRSGELPPLLIVGVANTPDRINEYTWVPGTVDGRPAGGKGPLYARFLIEEVKPFIDRSYRTLPDRDHTGVMGSSLGGLISLYLARYDGEVFGKVGAMSPSVWWDDREVLKDAVGIRHDFKLWLDVGTQEEGPGPESDQDLQDVRDLGQTLLIQGFDIPQSMAYMEDPGAPHNETAWARRAPMALQYLFGTDRPRSRRR